MFIPIRSLLIATFLCISVPLASSLSGQDGVGRNAPLRGGPDRNVPERFRPNRNGPERNGPDRAGQRGPQRNGPDRPDRTGPQRDEGMRRGTPDHGSMDQLDTRNRGSFHFKTGKNGNHGLSRSFGKRGMQHRGFFRGFSRAQASGKHFGFGRMSQGRSMQRFAGRSGFRGLNRGMQHRGVQRCKSRFQASRFRGRFGMPQRASRGRGYGGMRGLQYLGFHHRGFQFRGLRRRGMMQRRMRQQREMAFGPRSFGKDSTKFGRSKFAPSFPWMSKGSHQMSRKPSGRSGPENRGINRWEVNRGKQDDRRNSENRFPKGINHSEHQDPRMVQLKQFFGASFGNRGPTGPKRGHRGNDGRSDDKRGPNYFSEMRPNFSGRGPGPERSFERGRKPGRDGDSPSGRGTERSVDRGAGRLEGKPDHPEVPTQSGDFRSRRADAWPSRADARPSRMDAWPSRNRDGSDRANGRDRDSRSDRSPNASDGSSRGPSSRNLSSRSEATRVPDSRRDTDRTPKRELAEKKRVVEVEIDGDIGTITLKGSADDVRHFQQLLDRANSKDKARIEEGARPEKTSNSKFSNSKSSSSKRSSSKRADKRTSNEDSSKNSKGALPSKTAPESDLWKYV